MIIICGYLWWETRPPARRRYSFILPDFQSIYGITGKGREQSHPFSMHLESLSVPSPSVLQISWSHLSVTTSYSFSKRSNQYVSWFISKTNQPPLVTNIILSANQSSSSEKFLFFLFQYTATFFPKKQKVFTCFFFSLKKRGGFFNTPDNM